MRVGFAWLILTVLVVLPSCDAPPETPNVVLIYADDLGYGDVGSYGGPHALTPAIDRLASEGLLFTNAHSPSATCTPSRFAMLTGEYAWRKEGTGIARGDASLIIDTSRTTLADVFRQAGYATAVVGKWHLGLGPEEGADWNGRISPGPHELGFDYSFLIPATGDRVPTVYVENQRVVGLDPDDPIRVSFDGPIGTEPTGRERPDLLTMHPSHGHDHTIVNGISRIGYMSGGTSARWVDEDMADTIARKAVEFIERRRDEPFFLYFSTHDIHVPRVPHPRFEGKSGMGPRGDAIVQLDASVDSVVTALDRLGLSENTIVIFTSDNGPVLDDGYQDQAVELVGDHRPAGPLRGGKYSAFEAGTRVPFIVHWPGHIERGTSDALISQVDMPATMARLLGVELAEDDAPDSRDLSSALVDPSQPGRDHLVEHAASGTLSLRRGRWKYIEPSDGPRMNRRTNIELGHAPRPQLYDLEDDLGEEHNVAGEHPGVADEMAALLQQIREHSGRP